MNKLTWLLTLALVAGTPLQAAELTISNTVTSRSTDLTSKFLFPFTIPPGVMMTGLHGDFSIVGSVPLHHSEALISLHDASGRHCPQSGLDIGSYSAIFGAFPSSSLANVIIKQVGDQPRRERVDIDLPVGVPLNGRCGYVILDGSDFLGKNFTMSVNARLSYAPQKGPAASLLAMGDEFILGANNHSNAFRLTHILREITVVAVFGNVAAMTMLNSRYSVPNGDWTATHQLLVYRGGCAMFPDQFQDTEAPGLDASMQNRLAIYHATLSGFGNQAASAPFTSILPRPIMLHVGDCIVHAVRAASAHTTNIGAFNTELQAVLETVP